MPFARPAILRINGFQVWDEVFRSEAVQDRVAGATAVLAFIQAEVVGPVFVAAFTWLATFLAFWVDPRANDRPAPPRTRILHVNLDVTGRS